MKELAVKSLQLPHENMLAAAISFLDNKNIGPDDPLPPREFFSLCQELHRISNEEFVFGEWRYVFETYAYWENGNFYLEMLIEHYQTEVKLLVNRLKIDDINPGGGFSTASGKIAGYGPPAGYWLSVLDDFLNGCTKSIPEKPTIFRQPPLGEVYNQFEEGFKNALSRELYRYGDFEYNDIIFSVGYLMAEVLLFIEEEFEPFKIIFKPVYSEDIVRIPVIVEHELIDFMVLDRFIGPYEEMVGYDDFKDYLWVLLEEVEQNIIEWNEVIT